MEEFKQYKLPAPEGNEVDEILLEPALLGGGDDIGTPSENNKFVTEQYASQGGKVVQAGETIDGATTPVPCYQSDSDNEFYMCDANDTSKMKFLGFTTSKGNDGEDINMTFAGIVTGFTGLSEGEKYYLSDTAGEISSSPGTNEVLVGIAISERELLIQKGKRYASGTTTFNSTTTTAITTGFRPSNVRVFATYAPATAGASASSFGGWTVSGGNRCAFVGQDNSNDGLDGDSSSLAWSVQSNAASVSNSGTVTTITDTGFTLSNTNNLGHTVHIYWEANGEI